MALDSLNAATLATFSACLLQDTSGLRQFERIVAFHVAALLRTAPSRPQSLCLLQTIARITARYVEDAEDDAEGGFTDAAKLVADLVLHTARGMAGSEAVDAAAKLQTPKSAPPDRCGCVWRAARGAAANESLPPSH